MTFKARILSIFTKLFKDYTYNHSDIVFVEPVVKCWFSSPKYSSQPTIWLVSRKNRGWRNNENKKCYFTYEQRKQLLESVRYVDLVIPECGWDQKRKDVHEYHVDTFVMGDDWKGQFDFLEEEGAEVVYLPRTPEISTTRIKKDLNK